MEGLEGFEPSTRGLKGRCSNLLSYRPVTNFLIIKVRSSGTRPKVSLRELFGMPRLGQ